MAKKRKKRHGHYCWSCRLYLPNERFSGRGHQRHLCRACSRLGKDELKFRQAVRNIERCLGWDGQLRREQRKNFERFREHPNERVRRYVKDLEEHWAEERRRLFELVRQDEEALESLAGEDPEGRGPSPETRSYEDLDIPF